MIVNFFNKTKPINTVFLVGFLIFVAIFSFILDNDQVFSLTILVKKALNLILLIISFLIFNNITIKNSLTKGTDLGILFYFLLVSIFVSTYWNLNIISVNFLLLLSFQKIFQLQFKNFPKKKIFDSGFWLGIAIIIFPISFLFLIVTSSVIFLLSKANWRYFLIHLLGVLLPVFFFYTYLFFIDNTALFIESVLFLNNFDLNIYKTIPFSTPIVFIGFLLIWSILKTSINQIYETINFKSFWIIHLIHLFTGVTIIIITPNKDGSEFLFIIFPASILLANYIQTIRKKWIQEIIIYLFIILIIGLVFVK